MAGGQESKTRDEIGNQVSSQIKGLEMNQSNEALYRLEINLFIDDDDHHSSIEKLKLFAKTTLSFIKVFVILLLLLIIIIKNDDTFEGYRSKTQSQTTEMVCEFAEKAKQFPKFHVFDIQIGSKGREDLLQKARLLVKIADILITLANSGDYLLYYYEWVYWPEHGRDEYQVNTVQNFARIFEYNNNNNENESSLNVANEPLIDANSQSNAIVSIITFQTNIVSNINIRRNLFAVLANKDDNIKQNWYNIKINDNLIKIDLNNSSVILNRKMISTVGYACIQSIIIIIIHPNFIKC